MPSAIRGHKQPLVEEVGAPETTDAGTCSKVRHRLERALWWQFFGGPFAIMWMVGVPSAPGRCRVLYWFFTPSAGAHERLAKQAAEPDWKVSAAVVVSRLQCMK